MRVDPADLAATFGAGFALREITLEVTDDAVTEGVVEGFEFMQRLKSQATLSGLEFFSPDHSDEINYLTDKAFIQKAIK